MVNVRHLLISIAAVLTAIACNKAELEEINGAVPESGVSDGERMTLTITMDESLSNETKMEMGGKKDGKYPLYWTEGDEIAVFASEDSNTSEIGVYKFRAEKDGQTVTCVDVSDTPLPPDYIIRGALYPWKDGLTVSKSSVVYGIPSQQSGDIMDDILLYVSDKTPERTLVFSNALKYWKFVIPESWGATKLTLRSDDSAAQLSGLGWQYNLKSGTSGNTWSGSSESSVSVSAESGQTLKGEVVIATRNAMPKVAGKVDHYDLWLDIEKEGEMSMIQIPFGNEIDSYSSKSILKYNFSAVTPTWYSTETVELDFTSWPFSNPATSLLDKDFYDETKIYHYLNNRVYDFVQNEPGHIFKLYIPNVIRYASQALVLTGLEGADTDPSKAPYIEFPVLPGRALAKVEFTTTGGHQSNSTIEGPGSDGNPLVSEEFANSDKVLTKEWNFIRFGQTTVTGAAYRLQGHYKNSLTIKTLRLTYMGRDITRPDAIVTGDADVFATESEDYHTTTTSGLDNHRGISGYEETYGYPGNVKFHGSFVNHTGADGEKTFEYGIAYKTADGTDYTYVQADPNSTEAAFTATTTLLENTPYLYRAYVKDGGTYYYGLERRLLFIGMDFRGLNGEDCFVVKSGFATWNGSKYNPKVTKTEMSTEFYYPDATAQTYRLTTGFPDAFIGQTAGSSGSWGANVTADRTTFNNPKVVGLTTQVFLSIPAIEGYKFKGYTFYNQGISNGTRSILICNANNYNDTAADEFIQGAKSSEGKITTVGVTTNKEMSYTFYTARENKEYFMIESGNNWPICTVAFKYE